MKSLNLGLFHVFSYRSEVSIFGKNPINIMLCPLHIKGFMMSVCLITGDANLDHLAH